MWSHFEKDNIGKQLARASDSISANLSEAYGRFSFPDRKRFAYFARGSLCETVNWLTKAITRNMIDEVKGNKLLSELSDLSYGLNAYIKSLSKP